MELDQGTLPVVVVTILVTVVVTVLVTQFVSSSSSSSPANKAVESSASPPSSGGGKKKKKKKKGKGGASAEEDETPPAAVESSRSAPEPVTQPKKKKTNGNNSNDAAVDKENANENGATTTNGGGKPNGKKKKKKGGNNSNNNNNNKPAKENEAPTVNTPAPAPVVVPEEPVWQPAPRAVVEEEWNDVAVSKKKKKSQRPKKTTPAPAAAAVAAPTTLSDSVSVDAKKIGIIIGPKGSTMEAIKAATGCTLDINAPGKDDGDNNNKKPIPTNAKAGVVITGPTKEDIAKAKKAILELASKGYATLLQGDNFGEFSISVHPRFLSEIVGPSGKTIQALQKTLDVKITIPPTDWKPNVVQVGHYVKPCRVGIAGSKENSKTAKAAIQSIMQYHHHEITHPGMIHEEVYVPQEFFHCVIGPRGSEIKHIRGNYKVDVYMPNAESETDNVIVVGKQTNVDKAISYIQLLMDRDTEQRAKKYSDEYYG